MKTATARSQLLREVRQQAQVVEPAGPLHRRHLRDQRMQPADLRRRHGEVGRRDHRRHLHEELDHVDDEHAPQPGERGERHVEHADQQQRLPAIEAEQDAGDLARRQVHRRHDQAVEEQAEVDGAEAAQRRRGAAGVAQLVELEVGQDAGPPPQPGVEEDRRHAGQHERPPHPVAGDAVAPHDVGDQVRRVGAEGRRHHRQARPATTARRGPSRRTRRCCGRRACRRTAPARSRSAARR